MGGIDRGGGKNGGKNRRQEISEALDLLNELAKEKKAELQGMVSEKYGHLNSALGGASERLQHQAKAGLEQGKKL